MYAAVINDVYITGDADSAANYCNKAIKYRRSASPEMVSGPALRFYLMLSEHR